MILNNYTVEQHVMSAVIRVMCPNLCFHLSSPLMLQEHYYTLLVSKALLKTNSIITLQTGTDVHHMRWF